MRPVEKLTSSAPEVVDYYAQTIDDYRVWSQLGYMHFGLWRRWMNPFNRQSMLESMNDLVFDVLGLNDEDPSETWQLGDLGCGLAAVARYGHQKYPNHIWHAFTICPDQVSAARKQVDSEKLKVVCADYASLPLQDAELNGAFFLESLCHTSSLRRTLKESLRVLKPGGSLVVVDGMMRKRPAETPWYARRLAKAVCKSWALPQFHSTIDFESAAIDVGFEIEGKREIGMSIIPCVAHSPVLVALHSGKLIIQGKWDRWKRRHMIGCALGVFLGMLRHQFGYYIYRLRKP